MLDFPPDTPWIYAWLGASGLLGLIVGWLLGRIGRRRLKKEHAGLLTELDEALEARRTAEEATAESGEVAAGLQERLDETATSLGDADREIDRLRGDLDKAETRIAQLEIEAAGHEGADREESERLLARLSAADEEIDSLRAALSAATADTDARVSAAQSEAQEAISRAAALEDALSAAKLERENLLARLEEADGGEPADAGELAELRDQLEAARREAEETTVRLVATQQELDEALAGAPGGEDLEAELAARDHLIAELQHRVTAGSDAEDRLKAREAELAELERDHGAVLAVKEGEIRSLRKRLESLKAQVAEPAPAGPDPAEVERLRSDLAAAEERAAHWEEEAAGLRDAVAAPLPEPAPPEPAPPEPIPAPAPATSDVEARLDLLQETLADKEARIAYLADRVARLESTLGSVSRPAPAPTAPPPPTAAPVAEPEPAPDPDDLTQIWGIGPAIQRKFNSIGITTFEQIAVLGPAEQAQLGDLLGDFLDRFEADDWVGQARSLIEARGGTVPEKASLPPIKLTPPSAPVRPDDLTAIKGIGPFIEKTLNDLGVTTFAQIAAWTPEDVEHYGDALVIFQDRIEREGWVEQARELSRRR